MSIKNIVLFLITGLLPVIGQAQPCTTLGQNPGTAFPVCGSTTFTQNNIPLCGGTPIPTACTNGTYADVNPFWYRFTCFTSGTLGFIIDPMNNNDDYDWVLFDITGRNPNDIYTTLALNVAENWSEVPGNTGAGNNTNGLRNCAGPSLNFNSFSTITAGHEYLLMVSNWSNSQLGYNLTFTGGTAVITDPLLPAMQSASVSCSPTQITLRLNKKIRCNSVATNGSDFTIAGATVIAAAGFGCSNSFDLDSVLITLAAPLAPGNYTLTMANGSDGNTLLDNCGTGITAGTTVPFTVIAQSPLAMGAVVPPPCIPSSITLAFPERVLCNSIAANGSDFLVTGPSTVTIISAAAVNCNANGETDSITLQFSAPILVSGIYQVQVTTGTDGSTLTGPCNRQVTAGSNTAFTLAAQPPLPIGTVSPPDCSPSTIVLNFAEPFDCTSVSADGSEFLITGPSGVTVTAASGQCNVTPGLYTITLQLSGFIVVSGTYQVQVINGTDGNTIRGNCNRYITAGDITTFIIPDAPPSLMDSLVPIACSPSSLRVVLDAPIRCSSIAFNGSDFIISGPSPVTITSATAACNANALITEIDITLSSPIVVGGNYQLQLTTGNDGNTLVNECNRQTPATVIGFVISDTTSAEFQYQVQYDCETDVITFSHDGRHNVNQWTWTVNGAAASSLQSFTQSFPASSQNQVQLVVSNGMCSDTYSANIILDNQVIAAFEGPDMVCPGDSVGFINNSTGQIDTWLWNFGNGNTSSLQNPPPQVYPATGTETLYTVFLTVASNSGCQTSATHTIKVFASCIIAVPTAFTPNNDGLNDFLYPLNAIKAENLDFKVFNRWGQLVFHSTDWTKKWDGKVNGFAQATAVYVWTLNYTHKDTRVKYSLKGTTTLIR